MKRSIIKLSLLFFLIIFLLSPLTNSNYYDTETSLGNTISAGYWDTTAPIISNVSHLVATLEESNDTKATISWTTNEDADSNLYWTIDNVTWDTVSDSSFVTSHSLEILGLSTDTIYYYYVTSSDQAGNSTVSATDNFNTDGMIPEGYTPTTDIVINEFLPDPIGLDNALMPEGEWIEIYNRGSTPIDLTNWYLTNSDPTHVLDITTLNTVSSDSINDLWISPGEYMVVYQNGDADFLLDNNTDKLSLYDNFNSLIDQYSYDTSSGDVILENKSIARYPDGSNFWFDPIPTPLGPNTLEPVQSVVPSPELNLSLSEDKKQATFSVSNLMNIKSLSYELNYKAYDTDRGVIGSDIDVNGQTQYSKTVDLATCSSEVCTYDENVNSFKLIFILFDGAGSEKIIEKSLN